jgi:hypothetical protein
MSATSDNTLANHEQLIAGLRRRLAEREAELAQALEQQAATAEVLQGGELSWAAGGRLDPEGRTEAIRVFEPFNPARYDAPAGESYQKAFAMLDAVDSRAMAVFAADVGNYPQDRLQRDNLDKIGPAWQTRRFDRQEYAAAFASSLG